MLFRLESWLAVTVWSLVSAAGLTGQGLDIPEEGAVHSELDAKFSSPIAFAASVEKDLPAFHSLRSELSLPRPIDQRDPAEWGYKNCRNSCVAWAVGYALHTILRKSTDPTNPMYPYGCALRMNGEPYEDNGVWFGPAFSALNDQGFCAMDDYKDPLKGVNKAFVKACRNRRPHWKIVDRRLGRSNIVFDVKYEIAVNRMPVPCGFNVPEGFADNVGLDTVPGPDGKPVRIWKRAGSGKPMPHAMLVVGYDSRIGGPLGSFEVMNSHGIGFGNRGFVWIDCEFFAETGERPEYAMDNPCCVFAYSISLEPSSDNVSELDALKRLVMAGEKTAWVKLVDKENSANFKIPGGDPANVTKGDKLEVVQAIGKLRLRSNLDVVWGREELQTTISPPVGDITRRDVMEVSEVKKVTLKEKSGRKTEYWIKGTLVKDRPGE